MLEALVSLLRHEDDFNIIATVYDGPTLFDALENTKPDVILLDFKNSKVNGMEITKVIDEKMPWVKVISLSANNHPFYIKEMLKYGVKGFLSKHCSVQELYDGIRNVFNGKTFFCSHCSNILLRDIVHAPVDGAVDLRMITSREIEIIFFLSDGFTTKEISEKLFISSKTVERHKTNLLKKLKIKNTAQLIKIAAENGLLFS